MQTWIIRLLVAIATLAIARSVVSALRLDATVARIIQTAVGALPSPAVLGWIIPGVTALLL